jgi:ABC-2 type transport system permease protein
MQRTAAILRRELIAIFSSPLAYLVMTGFLLLQGLIFYLVVAFLNDPSYPAMAPLEAFFGGTIFYWLFLLFVIPVITMRLVAEERRSGTIEVLLTASVTEAQVILGKFLAALLFYIALWAPTAVYVVLLQQKTDIDPGPVLSGYLGTLLVGILFVSVGTFASTLTDNQLVAAIFAFVGLMALFTVPLIDQLLISESMLKTALGHMDLWTHMEAFAMGIVDTRSVVYPLSVAGLFLFFATKSLELKKWR